MNNNHWKWISLTLVVVLALVIGVPAIRDAHAAQPHMQSALTRLRAARSDLHKANPDKGGHRVKALELVALSIREVESGIAYDRRR